MTEPRVTLTMRQKRTAAAVIAAVVLAITGIGVSQCGGSSDSHRRTPSTTGPHCTKGCACGDTCIDCSLECHEKKPQCTKGCPCGDACIDCSLACHR